jgi:hypothetical protein
MGPTMTAPHQPTRHAAELGDGSGARVSALALVVARCLGRAWLAGITTTATVQGFNPGQAAGDGSTLTTATWRCASRVG